MNNGPDYEPATIEIGEVYFNKHGMLRFDGLVENEYTKVELEDMTKILPVICGEFEYTDSDGLHNATLDNFHNLFWHIKIQGIIQEKKVYLKDTIEQLLLEEYQKNQ